MILYFATGKFTNTIRTLRDHWIPHIAEHLIPMTYDQLFSLEEVPKATYLFTDFERMEPALLRVASAYADQLRPHGKILNEPAKCLTRLPLLTTLFQEGINDFRAFRISENPTKINYPVFLRLENDHKGPRSELLHNPRELQTGIVHAVASGFDPKKLLIIEFMSAPFEDGMYRRYGTHIIGEDVLHWIVTFGMDWRMKGAGIQVDFLHREERRNIELAPDKELIYRAFKLGNYDYGRMDYVYVNGKLQVYEINSNPLVAWRKPDVSLRRRYFLTKPFTKRFGETLLKYDTPKGPAVPIDKQKIIESVLSGMDAEDSASTPEQVIKRLGAG